MPRNGSKLATPRLNQVAANQATRTIAIPSDRPTVSSRTNCQSTRARFMAPLLPASRIGREMGGSHPSDRGSVRRRRALLIATASVVAAVDVGYKASVSTPYHHLRSIGIAWLAAGVIVALVVLVPRLPSSAASV